MNTTVAFVFLGLVALSSAGLLSTVPATIATSPIAYNSAIAYNTHQIAYSSPIAYNYNSPIVYSAAPQYYASSNYKLTLDTSLPGSAYAAYPNAAAPTAYGYGVVKTL